MIRHTYSYCHLQVLPNCCTLCMYIPLHFCYTWEDRRKGCPVIQKHKVHLHWPGTSAITSLNLVQFQNFKHQQLAYFSTIFWYLLGSSTPYQFVCNRTECRSALFKYRGPCCSTETKLYWLNKDINLLGEKLARQHWQKRHWNINTK